MIRRLFLRLAGLREGDLILIRKSLEVNFKSYEKKGAYDEALIIASYLEKFEKMFNINRKSDDLKYDEMISFYTGKMLEKLSEEVGSTLYNKGVTDTLNTIEERFKVNLDKISKEEENEVV